MSHANAFTFRIRHIKVCRGAVHALCCHRHTITAISAPVRENKSPEMETNMNEETYR